MSAPIHATAVEVPRLLYKHDQQFANIVHGTGADRDLPALGMRLCHQPKALLQQYADAVLAHCVAMQVVALEGVA